MGNLDELLSELESYGGENDARATKRSEKLLNITRDTGEFLAVILKAIGARSVLEIGTSNGYSTLWLASSIPDSGSVTTLEIVPHKIRMARQNFQRANLEHKINLLEIPAGEYFKTLDTQFDLVFLDANRSEYMGFADEAMAAVRPQGLLVCDNAVSHASELEEFFTYIKNSGSFTCCLVPVGKGEFVACKSG